MRSNFVALAVLAVLASCAPGDAGDEAAPEAGMEAAVPAPAAEPSAYANGIAELLGNDRAVFGYFPRRPGPDQADSLAGTPGIDFIMLSQEDELDVPALQAYVLSMNQASAAKGVEPIPILVRMPSVDDAQAAAERVRQVVDAGVAGIVFPHVNRAEQAEISVSSMGEQLWREGSARGELVNVQIVEEQEGIANVSDIMDTPGLSVVFAGPGTLRQSYAGDIAAVEKAIQTVLAACKQSDVPCGVTAGTDDIEKRLQEGFRVIIVYDLAALPIGRQAAGRTD